MQNRIFYGLFLAQAILLASAAGLAMAQSDDKKNDTTMTGQLTNLTNATSSPEKIKNMTEIGGTVNGTLNATGSGGMNATNATSMNATNSTGS